MLILAILAAASAWLVTRKAPQHRPIAWALTVCAGLDAVRLLGLPARVDMALCLGAPVASARAYVVTLDAHDSAPMIAPATIFSVGLAMILVGPWDGILPVAYAGTVIASGVAWQTGSRVWTISQRVALILLAGDALAVASLCAREWISNQAGVVLAAVTVYQVTWWWRWNCGE